MPGARPEPVVRFCIELEAPRFGRVGLLGPELRRDDDASWRESFGARLNEPTDREWPLSKLDVDTRTRAMTLSTTSDARLETIGAGSTDKFKSVFQTTPYRVDNRIGFEPRAVLLGEDASFQSERSLATV